MILFVCYQGVEGVSLLVDEDEVDLLIDFYIQIDFGKRCFGVGWQFSFNVIKFSYVFWKIVFCFIVLKFGVIVKGILENIKR